MLVRRVIDAAHNNNSGGMLLHMWDWAKALDRVTPDVMCAALGRFGLPAEIVSMIGAIYESRYFVRHDRAGSSSDVSTQGSPKGARYPPTSPSPCKAASCTTCSTALRDEPVFV
eukprot:8398187-Pyramimonas_sp.AAC.1